MKLKIALYSIAVMCLLPFLSTTAFAQKIDAPWKSLFNGENLDGWKMVGDK